MERGTAVPRRRGAGRRTAGLVLLLALQLLGPHIAQARKTLRVGVSGDYAPFAVEQDGQHRGLDIEIAARLGRDLGYVIRFVPFRWPDLLTRLAAGEIDVAMSGVTMHAERALVGRFTRPYASFGAMALIRVEDRARFTSLPALDRVGVRIAVNSGGYLEKLAREVFRHASVRTVTRNESLPEMVLAGSVDAVLTDSAEVRGWLRPELHAVGPFTHDHKAFLLPAKSALAPRLDRWLIAREKDGWLNAARVRWLGSEAAMDPEAAARDAAGALIRLRLELMPTVAAAKHAARLPIEDPAQEAKVLERLRTAGASGRTLAVYRLLIDLSKTVQNASAATRSSVDLPTLRAAIARIDEQLVHEIDAARGSFREWRDQLSRELTVPGVDAQLILRLAFALARPVGNERPASR